MKSKFMCFFCVAAGPSKLLSAETRNPRQSPYYSFIYKIIWLKYIINYCKKVKVKLSLCLTEYYAMETYQLLN
jgi:hypothetical protein